MPRIASFLAIASLVLLAGCSADTGKAPATQANADAAHASTSAHATLKATSNSHVSGQLAFVAVDDGVHITGQVNGLKPDSTHGFHLHANGNCQAPDASSAGGHFNPADVPHGHPGTKPHHAGDIPNQHADASGVATVDVVVPNVQLGTGSDTDILGRAVIVHAQPDDYTSQPSGAAGPRIACGVITQG
ncbi:MAG TPA: superoxide dismutase family protein [Oleiagrimonas sp.]|nr:superoxide dismutase family protein [Oleiagrimonas sp.]